MRFDGFDWDVGNRGKCRKHGVSVDEIEALFLGAARVGPDPRHSRDEVRFRAVGRSGTGRAIFVVFTWRTRDGRRLLRPISARYMHGKEAEAYEEAIPDVPKR